MKQILLIGLVIALFLVAGCAKEQVETTETPNVIEESVAEVDELNNNLVDSELDSELDNLNLDEW